LIFSKLNSFFYLFYSKTVFIFAPLLLSVVEVLETNNNCCNKELNSFRNKMMTQNRVHSISPELSLERFCGYSDKKLIDALYQKQKPLC